MLKLYAVIDRLEKVRKAEIEDDATPPTTRMGAGERVVALVEFHSLDLEQAQALCNKALAAMLFSPDMTAGEIQNDVKDLVLVKRE